MDTCPLCALPHTPGDQACRTADKAGSGKRRAKNVSRCSRDARLNDHAKYGIGHHGTHGLRHHRSNDGSNDDPCHYPTSLSRTTFAYIRSTSW